MGVTRLWAWLLLGTLVVLEALLAVQLYRQVSPCTARLELVSEALRRCAEHGKELAKECGREP